MSGLVWKELLIIRNGWKSYAFMIGIYAVLAITMRGTAFFSTMIVMLLLIIPLSSFATDEQARWDPFAAALPGGRRAMVRAKYQLLFLIMGTALLLSWGIGGLAVLLGRGEGTEYLDYVITALACVLAGLLFNSVLFPLLFRYGTQKARLLMAAVFGVIFAIFAIDAFALSIGVSSALGLAATAAPALAPAVVILAAAAVLGAALVLSYRLSCRICEKKEF